MALKRFVPITILLAGLIIAVYFDVHKYLSFEVLGENYGQIKNFIETQFILSLFIFALIYIVSVAFSIPGASFLTFFYGAVLGTWVAGTLIVFSATIGATFIFLAARYALQDTLKERAGPWLIKMNDGFKENAVSYMLFLRLVPLFPFFAINLVPAFVGVSIRVYIITTFIGIIPGTYVFASIGSGIDYIIAQGGTPDIATLVTPEILLPLAGLSILSFIPIIYKKIKRKNA